MTGKTIGRYEIIRELGIGGMAVVYLGMDPTMLRQVAVKVLPRQFTFDPQFRSRFQREAQVIAGLEHPAIVPVYDFGEVDDQPYIVMRYMPGGSLADRMEKSPLTLTEISNLFHRLAAALDAAHHNGLVHRDLKPANILFDQWGESYLSDFGIVRLAEAHSAYTGSAIIGTPAYMSPEQAKGKSLIDGRSDVYSLGIILYELLTQKLPYISDTPMGQAVAHIIEPVPDILKAKPTLPPACDAIIRRALAKEPEDRYPTAGALANIVAQLATNPNLVVPIALNPPPVKPANVAPSVANPPAAQPPPKSQPQKPLTPLPPKSGRPSTGQTILQKARSPWAIALTGASTLIFLGVALAMCVGGALALNYFRTTPTRTPSPTPTVTETPTPRPSATATHRATSSATVPPTSTSSATNTEPASETPTLTKTPRPAITNTPILPSGTPTPACAPSEFFDPLMNRCRTNDSGNTSEPTSSGSGGGNPSSATPTLPPGT